MKQTTTVTDNKVRVDAPEYRFPDKTGTPSMIRFDEELHHRAKQIGLDQGVTLVRQVNEGLELRLALYDGIEALTKLAREMVKR